MPKQNKKLIIAMTGATGAIYGVKMLQVLREKDGWEAHLIISSALSSIVQRTYPCYCKATLYGAGPDTIQS